MELSHSWEVASCATTQELPNVLWNPKVYYGVKKDPSTGLYPESDQFSPYNHTVSKTYFNIIHSPTPWSSWWSLSSWLSHQYPICIPLLPYSCYMPCSSYPPWEKWTQGIKQYLQSAEFSESLLHVSSGFQRFFTSIVARTCKNLIQEEIKRRSNSGNACYHSVQNLLYYRLLSRNIKTKIYKTIILPVVLYGCETWPLTIRVDHRLRVSENTVVRRLLEWRELKWREVGENYIIRSFILVPFSKYN
jgi:hypothetical protein